MRTLKGTSRLLGCIATVLAVLAPAAPVSHAQCQQTRNFGGSTGGKSGSLVVIDASAFQNNGNELAQFWQTGLPGNGTGTGQVTSTCPSQGVAGVANPWWGIHGPTGHRLIQGILSAGGCLLPLNCPPPNASLTFLVEDQTADGTGAGVVLYTVDETPPVDNWYDLTRTDPDVGTGSLVVHEMVSLPTVVITGSTGPPPNVTALANYSDIGNGFHGVQGAGNTPLPASAVIDSYDVMIAAPGADPGRDRVLWTLVHKLTYNDAAILGDEVVLPCIGELLAIGLTFDGGVEGSLVGPASLPISCCVDEVGGCNGASTAGGVPPLLVAAKVGTTGEIQLVWPASCQATDNDFAIYEGMLGGVFDSHVPQTCSTSGATEVTFTPNAQSSYYLVVSTVDLRPVPLAWEGSYGQSSFGERPRSDSACRPQSIAACADPS